MGIAVLVPNVSFASKNLGKVDVVENIPLASISISGESSVDNMQNTSAYSIEYEPINTSQRSIMWSIENGGEYASIDQEGVLTVKGSGEVTIKATSMVNPSISATKSVSVVFNIDAIFIRTTNNAYIDSGLKDTEVSKVEVIYKTSIKSSNAYIFGVRQASSASGVPEFGFKHQLPSSDADQEMSYIVKNALYKFVTSTNVEYKAILWKDGAQLWSGSEQIAVNQGTRAGGDVNLNIYIFGCNSGGTLYSPSATKNVAISSFKIYNNEGLLIKHLVGTEKDGVVCMYDAVSGGYVYPESGNFIKA